MIKLPALLPLVKERPPRPRIREWGEPPEVPPVAAFGDAILAEWFPWLACDEDGQLLLLRNDRA